MRWKLASLLIVLLLALPVAAAAEKRLAVAVGDSPTLGASDAPVTMIEFIDFQ